MSGSPLDSPPSACAASSACPLVYSFGRGRCSSTSGSIAAEPKARIPGLLSHFKGGHSDTQVSQRIVPREAKLLRKACPWWEIAKKFMANGENMMKFQEQLMGWWSIPIGVSLECHRTLSGLTQKVGPPVS